MDKQTAVTTVVKNATRVKSMNFRPSPFNYLQVLVEGKSYVGGSSSSSDQEFRHYINSKGAGDFGTCSFDGNNTCYYARVDDIKISENILLSKGPSCNISRSSNLNNKPGYVYVVK